MNNKEIELKFIIDEQTKKEIIFDLNKVSTAKTSRMIDTYYVPYFREFEINGETMECVRIREENGKAILTYKKIHRESDPVYCDEFETEVLSAEQTEKILFAIGFEIQMKIDKTRDSYSAFGFEFDFDSVKGLGEFLEVELKDEKSSTEDIIEFVKPYGLSRKNVTYDGIQKLMKQNISK